MSDVNFDGAGQALSALDRLLLKLTEAADAMPPRGHWARRRWEGLDGLGSETIRLLHDRRMPRSRANIDHLVVTPTGVYVIDAIKYGGPPT